MAKARTEKACKLKNKINKSKHKLRQVNSQIIAFTQTGNISDATYRATKHSYKQPGVD